MNRLPAILLIIVAASAGAESFPPPPTPSSTFRLGASLPELGFKDFGELEEWAMWTTLGSGSAGKLKLADTEVFYSDRMFTSGVPSSEVILYTKRSDDRLLPFLIIPRQGKENRLSVEQGNLVVRSYSRDSQAFEISVIVTPRMLP